MTPIRIFIVDDHPVVRRGLTSLLTNHQDFVIAGEAADVDAAMTAINRDPIDVVLLDIRLPGKSGLDLLDWIQEHHPQLKVIVLTSFDEDEYVRRALANGAKGFILKNTSDELLCDAVRTVYRNGRVLSSQVTEQLLQGLYDQDIIADAAGDTSEFSDEELHILHLLVEGASNDDIANELYLSVATIKRRLQQIFTKLGVNNRSMAIAETMRRNLFS